jgi:acetyl-CoA carboxylase biotin carboxyl carrier protein
MNTKEVLDMIQTLKETGYKHIDVAHEGSHIILSNSEYIGQSGHQVAQAPMHQAPTPQVQSLQVETSNQSDSEDEDKEQAVAVKGGHIVESPIVGTYYNAPSPDADPYITVGSKVKKGDVLCIIEAMKLMNEIEADQDGEIAEILVENEQGVEYSQPLFRIV